MTAAGLTAVCAEVSARERPTVVECGSGFSTLRLAEIVHERGGRLVSLEHDASWAARVARRTRRRRAGRDRARRARAAGAAPARTRRAALVRASTRCVAFPRAIDVLLVDGPPAFEPGAGLSRYPALPALAERLAPDAVVVLDDIDRPGEREVLSAWERDTDFRFERLDSGADRARAAIGFYLTLRQVTAIAASRTMNGSIGRGSAASRPRGRRR